MALNGETGPSQTIHDGPPYRPQYQSLGQISSALPDVPINAIFLCLFIAVGTAHFFVFRGNLARQKKFGMNMMVAVFCFTRTIATSLRMAWACHPTNVHVGITATIFESAGIVLLFLANVLFAERIVRAQHPRFGWSTPVSMVLPAIFVVTIGTILCWIPAVITSFYTLNPSSQHAARGIIKYGSTMMAIIASLPFIVVGASTLARQHPHIRTTKTTDKFGEGSMRAKVATVLISSLLLAFGAWFRAGTTLTQQVPTTLPGNPPQTVPAPWYLSKACFYIFNFTIESIVCFSWLVVRIDKRFHIPDGAKGPFSYAGGFIFAGEPGCEKNRVNGNPSNRHLRAKRPASSSSKVSSLATSGDVSSKTLHEGELECRVSWGGIPPDRIQDGLGEDGRQVIRYSAFTDGEMGDVEEAEKEMGWDAKTGRWAIRSSTRCLSTTNSRLSSVASSPRTSLTRPVSSASRPVSAISDPRTSPYAGSVR